MAFVEDLTPFFADFGEVVTVDGQPVTGIHDNAFAASLHVETTKPVLVVKDSDVAGITHGAAVVARSINYQVAGIHPDGTGLTVLELEAV